MAISEQEREKLITDNQGLVYHLAARAHRSLPVRHEFDDLVGYGMLGLAEAAKSYSPSRKTKFSTFAFFRIRGAIYDGISETCWMSRSQYRSQMVLIKENQQRLDELSKKNDAFDGDEREAEAADWDAARSEMVALTAEHMEQLEDSEDSVSTFAVKTETETLLCEAVERLPRRENRLITMVYFEGRSLQDAAERIGVSKSWASRIHRSIIERLANELNRSQSLTKNKFTASEEKGLLDNG